MSAAAALAVTREPRAAAAGQTCPRIGILAFGDSLPNRAYDAERTTLATREPRRDTGALLGGHAAPRAPYIADAELAGKRSAERAR